MSRAVDRFVDAAGIMGHRVEVRRFPQGTRTASEAAAAIGCRVEQIVKSLVFMADGRPVLALTSGANRVDTARLATLAGAAEVRRASPDEARAATGYAIGGTPPLGCEPRSGERLRVFIDRDLMSFDVVWAAAGAPDAVFPLSPDELVRLSGGAVIGFAQMSSPEEP
ncbi:MAG TPA: YbaK/EbsC family protein [Actinomycetota bacterium]|jgi:prolyl-tRNA editing enzyme YbaK/EbsC (Cys-tRNA(Pro) deacylase)|nr:YbaK/EbsC family protein [Actinomycetota bacterium]